MNIKRKGLWSLVALLLAALTIYAVMHGSGMTLADFFDTLQRAKIRWLLAAVFCMLGFIFFEGMAVRSILKSCGYPRKHRQGLIYGAADVYFSAITPSASGGQPASAFFMIKDGVPGAVVTATLLLNLIMYNLAILTLGLIGIVLRPQMFLNFEPLGKILILVGLLVITVLTLIFLLLLWKREILFRLAVKLTGFLHKIHLMKNPEKLQNRLLITMEEYKQCVKILAGQKKMWLEAYLFNVLQRGSQILVSGMVFRALGGGRGMLRVLVSQCFVTIGANCIPIPGAMGVTDILMLDGYMDIMPREAAFEVQLLSRTISFYVCIIVSALIVLAGWLWLKYRKKHGKELEV